MADPRKDLSELELKLMRYLASCEPMQVREVADDFGVKHGYALTTILTVMERLRSKGYLTRTKKDGVNVYSSCLSQADLMQGVVKSFVNKALDGSVVPLVAFLSKDQELSDEEVAKLREFVDSLESGGGSK